PRMSRTGWCAPLKVRSNEPAAGTATSGAIRRRSWCSRAGASATRAVTAAVAQRRPSTHALSAFRKRSSTGRSDVEAASLAADDLGERFELLRVARDGFEEQMRRAGRSQI